MFDLKFIAMNAQFGSIPITFAPAVSSASSPTPPAAADRSKRSTFSSPLHAPIIVAPAATTSEKIDHETAKSSTQFQSRLTDQLGRPSSDQRAPATMPIALPLKARDSPLRLNIPALSPIRDAGRASASESPISQNTESIEASTLHTSARRPKTSFSSSKPAPYSLPRVSITARPSTSAHMFSPPLSSSSSQPSHFEPASTRTPRVPHPPSTPHSLLSSTNTSRQLLHRELAGTVRASLQSIKGNAPFLFA